jgi:hypothetical protein
MICATEVALDAGDQVRSFSKCRRAPVDILQR